MMIDYTLGIDSEINILFITLQLNMNDYYELHVVSVGHIIIAIAVCDS